MLQDSEPHFERTKRHGYRIQLLTLLGLILVVGVVTRLPFVPYNVRELNSSGIFGMVSTVGLAIAIFWIANGHFLFIRWAESSRMLMLPIWLVVHGLVTWIFIRLAIPLESIHDILGTPVLSWPWEWELIGRYISLHAVIEMQAFGAALFLLLFFRQGQIVNLMIWLMYLIILAWPLNFIVVEAAATDNLTELMRDGGSLLNSAILASGIFAFFLAAGAISASFSFSGYFIRMLLVATIASLVAAVAFWFGSEQVIVKYGKTFSAWQFLLSTNRQHYTGGSEMYLRYLVAYAVMVLVLVGVQISSFQNYFLSNPSSRNP